MSDETKREGDPLVEVVRLLGDILGELRYALRCQTDLIKLKLFNIAVLAGLGVVGLICFFGVVIAAANSLFHGISLFIQASFGLPTGVGFVIAGLGALSLIGGGAYLATVKLRATHLSKTVGRHSKQPSRATSTGKDPRNESTSEGAYA